MQNTSQNHKRQLWTIERLERICRTMQASSRREPCLEQYEYEVALMMDEPVSDAASEWIALIVQALRNGEIFEAEQFLPAA